MGHIVAGKYKLGKIKYLMQMIEMFSKMEGIYKGREGWDLTYKKLLWEKVGNKHLLSEFGGRN